MSEYTLLSLAKTEADFNQRRASFWKTYLETLKDLATQESLICRHIEECFGEKDPLTPVKTAFVHERLSDYQAFFEAQQRLYDDAFTEMVRRKKMKSQLQAWVSAHSHDLDEYPWLKMYYLADRDRFSTFFLLEDRDEKMLLAPLQG